MKTLQWLGAAVAALTLAGCTINAGSDTTTTPTTAITPTTQSQNAALAAWIGAHASGLLQLGKDINQVQAGGNAANMTEIVKGCLALRSDATKDASVAPIPDAQIEAHWSAALTEYASGAKDCLAGFQQGNLGLVAQYKSYRNAANAQIGQVAQELQQLAGG